MKKFVAMDLGAESGKVTVGDISGMEAIYHFLNNPVRIKESIYWDILGIFIEVKKGLKRVFKKYPPPCCPGNDSEFGSRGCRNTLLCQLNSKY